MHWCTPDISDRFADAAVLCVDWRHYGGQPAFCGPLVTVRAPADNSRVRELAHQPGQGRVMLVDGGADRQHALLGDLIAAAALANGWAGIIVHGCVRDVPLLAQIPIDLAIREGGDAGAPAASGTGVTAERFEALAKRVLAELDNVGSRDAGVSIVN